MFASYRTGIVVDITPDALLMVLSGQICDSSSLKIMALCMLFIFAGVG